MEAEYYRIILQNSDFSDKTSEILTSRLYYL